MIVDGWWGMLSGWFFSNANQELKHEGFGIWDCFSGIQPTKDNSVVRVCDHLVFLMFVNPQVTIRSFMLLLFLWKVSSSQEVHNQFAYASVRCPRVYMWWFIRSATASVKTVHLLCTNQTWRKRQIAFAKSIQIYYPLVKETRLAWKWTHRLGKWICIS